MTQEDGGRMDVDLGRLRHWSRVAFAARCARRVQPLFEEAWPDADARRKEAIETAISLAEQSAARGRPCEGLEQAEIEALMVAGRAQIPHLYSVPIKDSEPSPLDQDAAVVASMSAKAAEKAVQAAAAAPSESATPAREAYYFALDAIRTAGRLALEEVLEADFVAIVEDGPKKPWWQFW